MIFPPSPRFSMRRYLRNTLLWSSLLLAAHCSVIKAAPAVTADAVQEAFVRAAERIRPGVVTIYVERRTQGPESGNNGEEGVPSPFVPRTPDGERSGLGSGMVVDTDGTILTNYHVVKNATLIRVAFNANESRPEQPVARLAGFDEESDLAVLQLVNRSALRTPLQPVEFADSDAVRVGEWAIAVGAPFDQAQSVTVGVISAKGRHLDRDNRLSLQDYLQTDASINPGNSGGPLLNLNGQVIGINTAILSPSRYNVGIGFAVPSNTARAYWPLLKAGKSIARGFLGIRYLALDDQVAREFKIEGGMQIGGLAKRGDDFLGPAKAAGLQEGDIITHVNGHSVTTTQEFRKIIVTLAPGSQVQFTVLRPEAVDNPTRKITLTLGDWAEQNAGTAPTIQAAPNPAPTGFSKSGMRLEEIDKLTPELRTELGVGEKESGLIVTEILPGSPADIAQIQRGLRIGKLRIDGIKWIPLSLKSDFEKREASLPPGARILLQTRDRQATLVYKVIELP